MKKNMGRVGAILTAVLVLAAALCIGGLSAAAEGTTVDITTEADLANIEAGATVELKADLEVTTQISISVEDVTFNGNGHKITASADFVKAEDENRSQNSLFNVLASGVTLNNLKLVATEKNAHTLNIWAPESKALTDVKLNNLTLDHKAGYVGAPLVITCAEVSIEGELNLVTGPNSWYGVNVDTRNTKDSAKLTFKEGCAVHFDDESGNEEQLPLVFPEVKDSGNKVEDLVVNPQYAGLELTEEGSFEHVHVNGAWSSDEESHWHECTVCGAKSDTAAHESDEGTVTKEATETEKGEKTYKCKVCGAVLKTEEIPVIAATTSETTSSNQAASSSTTSSAGNAEGKNPTTGDEFGAALWMIILAASVTALGAFGLSRSKKVCR